MNIEVYDRFAKYYDILASDIDFVEKQISVLTSIFERYGVKTVLDCACGTGSAVICLKELGYDVVGTDGSEGMLAIARRKASEKEIACQFHKVSWIHLDRFAKEIDRKFDAVICIGNSIFYSPPAELPSIFAGMYNLLEAGGICVIDNRHWEFNKETGRLEEPRDKFREHPNLPFDGGTVDMNDICKYEDGKQVITYSVEPSGTDNSEYFTFVGFPVLSEDTGKMMEEQGFRDIEIMYDTYRWKYEIIRAQKIAGM